MIMNGKTIRKRLDSLYEKAPGIALGAKDKWVVFSDLHLGDGGAGDDFRINDDLFSHVLEKHYGPENFSLILNGDVEELLRFLARPLRIRNYSVARSSRKKFAVERAIRETGCTIAPSLWFPACSIRDAPSARKGSPPSRLMKAASAWFIGQTEIGTHARLRAVGPRPRLRTRPPFSGWFCRKKLLIISSLESGFSRSLTP
jgi:hypothetical protein